VCACVCVCARARVRAGRRMRDDACGDVRGRGAGLEVTVVVEVGGDAGVVADEVRHVRLRRLRQGGGGRGGGTWAREEGRGRQGDVRGVVG
jgi:hypothetical protein